MRAVLHFIIAGFIVADCRSEAPALLKRDPTTTTTDGKLDRDGRLVFYEKKTGDVSLRKGEEFGMMVFYNEGAENPKPRYHLFFQPEHRIVRTESFADFAAALDKIPAASRVYLFDLCTGGSHYRMPDKFMDEIRAALKKRKLKLTKPGYIICTCPP